MTVISGISLLHVKSMRGKDMYEFNIAIKYKCSTYESTSKWNQTTEFSRSNIFADSVINSFVFQIDLFIIDSCSEVCYDS